MNGRLVVGVATVFLVAVVSISVFAQDIVNPVFAPFAANIIQDIPAEIEVSVPLEDGEIYTATLPITVSVALRVEVRGPNISVTSIGESEADVSVETLAAEGNDVSDSAEGDSYEIDGGGKVYFVEPTGGLSASQLRSTQDSRGRMEIVGTLTNSSSAIYDYPQVHVILFDN